MRALGCLVLFTLLAVPAAAKDGKGKRKVERYPPSFRIAVKEAIQAGVEHLRRLQQEAGHFGNPEGDQALGNTALPTLALLKAGVSPDDEAIQRAFAVMRKMPLEKVYSVACYLMAIQAKYAPKLDTFDTDVGSMRAKRLRPKEIKKQLSKVDRKAIEAGLDFLVRAQNANGLWYYGVPADEKAIGYDLSNTQYALLGLRAAADCGILAKGPVWLDALRALVDIQDPKGDEIEVEYDEEQGDYLIRRKEKSEVRPFRYKHGRKDGPLGEKTVPTWPATGSMTSAGIACVAICSEGLWRSRSFKGKDRREAARSIRDAVAWLYRNWSVKQNPGHPRKAHHLYYLYGIERMGMLTDRRFVGLHDWYKEGADLLLSLQNAGNGGWGNHVNTSFAILFLKRATRGSDRVQTTGG
ncbi:MAG: hypothetical protein QNJ98_15440 [Planctomycetota bacterium]|nr:hypothetical protein [Planctomycetota bacterium]